MKILRSIPRVAFAMLAALAGPCLGAWAADGADPASPDEKQALIRKHIAAHASEDPRIREEAQQALLKIGGDAMEELARSIERSDAVRERLAKTLGLLRDLELTPDQQKMMASLRQIRVTLEFQEQPVREVLEFLRQFAQLNFVTSAEVQAPALLTLKVRNLPLENVLNLITEPVGMVWYLDGHAIVFTLGKNVEPRHQLWIKKHLEKRPDPKDLDVLAIQDKLDNKKIELDFAEAGLEDVVEFVRQFSGTSMVIDPAVRGDKAIMDRKVTFKIRDVALSECLKLLLSQYGLGYSIRERVIYISRPPVQAK